MASWDGIRDTYQHFRVPGVSPDTVRDADDLPGEEIACAALFILRRHISVPEADLAGKPVASLDSSGRVSASRRRMLTGIELLIQRGAARRDDSAMTLQVS